MKERETDPKAGEEVREALRAFYNLHPYPPPLDDLDGYRQRWQDEGRRRADFYLHWSDQPYRTDLKGFGCRVRHLASSQTCFAATCFPGRRD